MTSEDLRTLELDEFTRLVDAHLTPHLDALAYTRLDPYVNDQPGSRSLLTSDGYGHLPAAMRDLVVGFEARDVEAAERLGPHDPESCDEFYLHLDTVSGELDFHLDQPLRQLVAEYAEPERAELLLSPEAPTEARLRILGGVLAAYTPVVLGR